MTAQTVEVNDLACGRCGMTTDLCLSMRDDCCSGCTHYPEPIENDVDEAAVIRAADGDVSVLEAQAERELQGLGDASLGEWREFTGRAFHLRRRLSLTEAESVGPVVDIRRTPEARKRAQALGKMLRYMPEEVLLDEIG